MLKTIDCAARPTGIVCCAFASLYFALPGWSASTTQVPICAEGDGRAGDLADVLPAGDRRTSPAVRSWRSPRRRTSRRRSRARARSMLNSTVCALSSATGGESGGTAGNDRQPWGQLRATTDSWPCGAAVGGGSARDGAAGDESGCTDLPDGSGGRRVQRGGRGASWPARTSSSVTSTGAPAPPARAAAPRRRAVGESRLSA